MRLTKQNAIQRCFDKCNLIGDNVNIYEQIYKFKVLRDLPEYEIEEIYNEIAYGLGF